MQINDTDYNVKVEQSFNGVVKYICTPKERHCDNDDCNKLTRYDKLNFVKFATENNKQKYMIMMLIRLQHI